jgi:hypothetical protein
MRLRPAVSGTLTTLQHGADELALDQVDFACGRFEEAEEQFNDCRVSMMGGWGWRNSLEEAEIGVDFRGQRLLS